MMGGWALGGRGGGETRGSVLRQGLGLRREITSEIALPQFLSMQAEALGKADKPREGLAVLSEALSTAERNGNYYYDAEVHRLKGEMLLCENAPEAEACFHRSIE